MIVDAGQAVELGAQFHFVVLMCVMKCLGGMLGQA